MHMVDRIRQSTKIEDRLSHTTALRSNTALPSITKHRQQLAADRYMANAHLHQQTLFAFYLVAFGPLIPLPTGSESTSTHYETFTLINVALTIAAIPHAHITGSVAATAKTNPYALIDGGDTPSPLAVAASVRRQPSVLNIFSGQHGRPGVMPGVS
ncbi:MAG: hypothetical protein Q9185_000712 [Variospora sp. 1 TL-2023]